MVHLLVLQENLAVNTINAKEPALHVDKKMQKSILEI